LNDNLEKKLDMFLELSNVTNDELRDFNHILSNVKAFLEGKIDSQELYSLTNHYDKRTIGLVHDIIHKVVRRNESTLKVKKVLKMILRNKK